MAEDFQTARICGGTWWNSSNSVFAGCFLPGNMVADMGNNQTFGWQNADSSMKLGVSCTDNNSNSSSIVFAQKQHEADSDSGGSSVTIDSTLQMLGLGFSSPVNSSSDWNQNILQEDLNSSLMGTSQDGQGFLSSGFPINPSVVPSSYGYSSSNFLQSIYEPESCPSFLNNNMSINNDMSCTTTLCSNDLSSLSWPKTDTFSKPSAPIPNIKQQACGYNLSNTNTLFWNSSTSAPDNNRTSGFIPSSEPPASQGLATRFEDKPLSRPNLTTKMSAKGVRDPGLAKKKPSDEPAMKKQRTATPSPLPPFKVRKENLRDQITALQQLVSPFGKTDTASVLQEAIEYIKFLHDQVGVLSTPYMKQGACIQQQPNLEISNQEDNNQDLKSRGLCLVPISSTFPVTNETTADFWTPAFGRNLR